MNWFQKWMTGRYGYDQLSATLLILSLVLLAVGQFTNVFYVGLVGLLPLGWCMGRVFSRNVSARRAENTRFLRLTAPLVAWFRQIRLQWTHRKTHIYFHCPKCRQSLRVPRGKGKLMVTCSKCGHKFSKKS